MAGSCTGARAVVWEIDCLLLLSLFSTELALFNNLERPLDLRSPSPAPSAVGVLIVEVLKPAIYGTFNDSSVSPQLEYPADGDSSFVGSSAQVEREST